MTLTSCVPAEIQSSATPANRACSPSHAQIFLPTFSEGPADEVQPNLYLGSEANASDLVWLKVEGITHVLSIQGQPIDVAP